MPDPEAPIDVLPLYDCDDPCAPPVFAFVLKRGEHAGAIIHLTEAETIVLALRLERMVGPVPVEMEDGSIILRSRSDG